MARRFLRTCDSLTIFRFMYDDASSFPWTPSFWTLIVQKKHVQNEGVQGIWCALIELTPRSERKIHDPKKHSDPLKKHNVDPKRSGKCVFYFAPVRISKTFFGHFFSHCHQTPGSAKCVFFRIKHVPFLDLKNYGFTIFEEKCVSLHYRVNRFFTIFLRNFSEKNENGHF